MRLATTSTSSLCLEEKPEWAYLQIGGGQLDSIRNRFNFHLQYAMQTRGSQKSAVLAASKTVYYRVAEKFMGGVRGFVFGQDRMGAIPVYRLSNMFCTHKDYSVMGQNRMTNECRMEGLRYLY
jgi:hypothetical protein